MGDRCRVYNMNALRELVVEAKVEEELERRKRVARKKSMAASAATGIGASALSLSGGNLRPGNCQHRPVDGIERLPGDVVEKARKEAGERARIPRGGEAGIEA